MRLSKALATYRVSAQKWYGTREVSHNALKAKNDSPPWNGRITEFEMIYEVTDENPQIPTEVTEVQRSAIETLEDVRRVLAPYVDALITRDTGNQEARADIVIDDVTVAEAVPAVALIALENDFRELVTLVREAPEAPRDEEWSVDPQSRLLRSNITTRLRQAKKRISRIVSGPTQYQQAVIDTYQEDVPVARQKITKLHGGLTTDEKRTLVEAAEKVFLAVQKAREEANAAFEVDPVTGIGESLLRAALPSVRA